MPYVFSHPAVPLALATVLPHEVVSPSMVRLGVACSTIPDLDVVGFTFGVPRGHVLAHRGLSHSIGFAVCLSGCLAWLLPAEAQPRQASYRTVFPFLCLSTLLHGFLDVMTDGGSSVLRSRSPSSVFLALASHSRLADHGERIFLGQSCARAA
jgi:inner membrane protein